MKINHFIWYFNVPLEWPAMKEDSEVLGLWAAGSVGTSGGHMFDYKNPFDVYFPDHVESAGEAPVSTEAETESKTHHVGPIVTAADFVHELVPAEGHMINPSTGETVSCLRSLL